MSVPQLIKPVVPVKVDRRAIDAYRKSKPLFTEFLLATGRVVIEDVSGQPTGAQDHGIKSSAV